MAMFPKIIEWQPIGQLKGEGQSSVWEGRVHLSPFQEDFTVRLHGEKSAPTELQKQAFINLLHNAEQIRTEANDQVLHILEAAQIVPNDVNINSANVWDYLKPCFIEVHPADYFKTDDIAISIGFSVPWDDDHLLQIATINGKFNDVYAE